MPENSVQHSPQMKAVSPGATHLRRKQLSEIVGREKALLRQPRPIERLEASLGEIAFAEPLLHRSAEALLATVNHVFIDVRLRRFLDDSLAHAVPQLVRRR